MRRLILGDVFSLGPFLTLYDFKLYVITLLQALVTFGADGAVMDENIRTVIASDEAESLGIVEPLNLTFDARHLPSSVHKPVPQLSRCGPNIVPIMSADANRAAPKAWGKGQRCVLRGKSEPDVSVI